MFRPLKKTMGVLLALIAILCGISVSAQNKAVKGTVVDADGGPVIGAYVTLVGNTSVGAVTDINGAFSLNVPAGASLEVSCIGYATQEIPVGDKTVINVVLLEDVELLEETVVVGYGTQKKASLTSAISNIRSEELTATKQTDVLASL